MTDLHDIILQCSRQKASAQQHLYLRFKGLALKTVFRYIYRHEEALDVVTDGFVKIFRSIGSFDTHIDKDNIERLFMAWLKRIMINTAIDKLRKKSMLPEVGALPEQVWNQVETSVGSEDTVRYKELILLIKKLPPQYRAVFNLYVIDGYSHNEIADMLNIPVGTSKSNLSRARNILQEKIKQADSIDYAAGQ